MQVYIRPKKILMGSSLAFNLKEGHVRCAKVCDKSWVILNIPYMRMVLSSSLIDFNINFVLILNQILPKKRQCIYTNPKSIPDLSLRQELLLCFHRGVGTYIHQCWTKDRSSTAVAEDLRPTDTATVAEV